MSQDETVTIVGGGLAGCEAAWQLAESGIEVTLHEMRPTRSTDAHKTDRLAELVCSNSFRSDNPHNAIGLLHRELRGCGSLILEKADEHAVPAGDALAVDRERFADAITTAIHEHPRIQICREEVTELPEGRVIIATGPLTSSTLADVICSLTDAKSLAFFDAIAPILDADSVNMNIAFAQSRYDKGEGADYLNCPMDKSQYEQFLKELLAAELVPLHEFEEGIEHFPGCLPIEVMANQGWETLRYGPMKPVGLTDPKTDAQPYAVVQLRKENKAGTAYNMVGFQTKMKYGEQRRILRMIPGLEDVVFHRLGSVHRNTFINSPQLLDQWMRLKTLKRVQFAGQLTGVEGYVESTACGLLVAWALIADLRNIALDGPPNDTALGAMMSHLRVSYTGKFQPQNVNFGLFPPLEKRMPKRERKAAYAERATASFEAWCQPVRESLSIANTVESK